MYGQKEKSDLIIKFMPTGKIANGVELIDAVVYFDNKDGFGTRLLYECLNSGKADEKRGVSPNVSRYRTVKDKDNLESIEIKNISGAVVSFLVYRFKVRYWLTRQFGEKTEKLLMDEIGEGAKRMHSELYEEARKLQLKSKRKGQSK